MTAGAGPGVVDDNVTLDDHITFKIDVAFDG
jgi:hypothetical protein